MKKRIVVKLNQFKALYDELEAKLKQLQTCGVKFIEAVLNWLVAA